MNFIDGVGGGVQCSIETESDLGGRKIIVDRLGYPDNFHAFLKKVECNLLSAIAADYDQGVHAERSGIAQKVTRKVMNDFLSLLHNLVTKRVAAVSSAQNGAAPGEDSAYILERQGY